MSTPGPKKLTLALHLDPLASAADKETLAALQHWYESNRHSCGNQAELKQRIRTFHHDVYLAGLRLYLLDPRLCQQVAETLEQPDLKLDGLIEQLRVRGHWPEAPEQSFSGSQLSQLQALLAATNPINAESVDMQESTSTDSDLSQQLSEQHALLNEMQAELQTLRRLAEEQAQQLRKIKPAATRKPTAKSKARSTVAEDRDVSDMTTQIAQMKKVRAKGVF